MRGEHPEAKPDASSLASIGPKTRQRLAQGCNWHSGVRYHSHGCRGFVLGYFHFHIPRRGSDDSTDMSFICVMLPARRPGSKALKFDFRHRCRDYQVKPGGQSVAGTSDLNLDNRRGFFVIFATELLSRDGCWAFGKYCIAVSQSRTTKFRRRCQIFRMEEGTKDS